MPNENTYELDDGNQASRGKQPPDHARAPQILFALGSLKFQPLAVRGPVLVGRQILEAAGLRPEADYSLFHILPSGDFEDVRLDEAVNLRGKGAERFIAFLTDRIFKFTLNDAQIEWGAPTVAGEVLYELAKPSDNHAIFLEVPGEANRLIDPDQLIDLAQPGVERFITAPKTPESFVIVVNSRPKTLSNRRVTFAQVVQLAFPGQHNADVVFSMTYRHAASTPHAGELGNGGVVEVKPEGTVFNVTRTVQS